MAENEESPSFNVLLAVDPECGDFTVTVPAIPAIVTEGDDEAHALAMAREAISLYLKHAAAKGRPLPIERSIP